MVDLSLRSTLLTAGRERRIVSRSETTTICSRESLAWVCYL
jgi:hypothetical protein